MGDWRVLSPVHTQSQSQEHDGSNNEMFHIVKISKPSQARPEICETQLALRTS